MRARLREVCKGLATAMVRRCGTYMTRMNTHQKLFSWKMEGKRKYGWIEGPKKM